MFMNFIITVNVSNYLSEGGGSKNEKWAPTIKVPTQTPPGDGHVMVLSTTLPQT